MVLTMRQVLLPEKMDFSGSCFMRGRDRTLVVNLSDLVLVPYQECKERLVPTILGKSVPGSTFTQCFRYFYARDVAKGRKDCKLDLSTNRGLNSSPTQEQNLQLTHDMICQGHPMIQLQNLPVQQESQTLVSASNCSGYRTVLKADPAHLQLTANSDVSRGGIHRAS